MSTGSVILVMWNTVPDLMDAVVSFLRRDPDVVVLRGVNRAVKLLVDVNYTEHALDQLLFARWVPSTPDTPSVSIIRFPAVVSSIVFPNEMVLVRHLQSAGWLDGADESPLHRFLTGKLTPATSTIVEASMLVIPQTSTLCQHICLADGPPLPGDWVSYIPKHAPQGTSEILIESFEQFCTLDIPELMNICGLCCPMTGFLMVGRRMPNCRICHHPSLIAVRSNQKRKAKKDHQASAAELHEVLELIDLPKLESLDQEVVYGYRHLLLRNCCGDSKRKMSEPQAGILPYPTNSPTPPHAVTSIYLENVAHMDLEYRTYSQSLFAPLVHLRRVEFIALPQLTVFGRKALSSHPSIEVVILKDLPVMGRIDINCFYGCKKLHTLEISNTPELRYIGKNFCRNIPTLSVIRFTNAFPSITAIGPGFLRDCPKLSAPFECSMPALMNIGGQFLMGCTGLPSIHLMATAKLGKIGPGFAKNCTSLKTIKFDRLNSLQILCKEFAADAVALQLAELPIYDPSVPLREVCVVNSFRGITSKNRVVRLCRTDEEELECGIQLQGHHEGSVSFRMRALWRIYAASKAKVV